MKHLLLFLIFLPFTQNAQRSIVELLTSLNSSHEGKVIKENHVSSTFTLEFDEEQKGDTIINIDGENKKFKQTSKKIYSWESNILKIVDTSPNAGFFQFQSFEFDKKGNVIVKETKDPNDSNNIMNEKNIFTYDDQNRMKSLRLIKENMNVDNYPFEAEYASDSDILPISAKVNIMLEFDIKREPINTGFRFNFDSKIPQEMIDMVKESLGGNPTKEEIMKELGPFGKCYKKYSDIIFLDENTLKEDVYEEDKTVPGKMDLLSTYVFNKKYEILSKNVFTDGQISESVIYEYNDNGKIISIQKGEEDKQVNTFDENGNLTKEFTDFGYITRIYKNGKLIIEVEYSFDELTSITINKYY